MNENQPLLLWFDLETTGLEVVSPDGRDGPDEIIEVGWGLTTVDLHQIAPNASLLVDNGFTTEQLQAITPEFVLAMHAKSGLWDACSRSEGFPGIRQPLSSIERIILNIIDAQVDRDVPVTVAGLGVSTFDIPIIKKYMPSLARRVTYYPFDVSSFERVAQSLVMHEIRSTSKSAAHRAVADIEYAQDLVRKLQHEFTTQSGFDWHSIFPEWRN